nr:hypothetical protein [Tilapia lake virus]
MWAFQEGVCKGNLLSGPTSMKAPDSAARESLDRASEIMTGKSYNAVHTGDLSKLPNQGESPLRIVDSDLYSERSCCWVIEKEGRVVCKSTTLTRGMTGLLNTTRCSSPSELICKVLTVESLSEKIGDTSVEELLSHGRYFKCALRDQERGKPKSRAIFLSHPFFRLLSSVVETHARSVLSKVSAVYTATASAEQRAMMAAQVVESRKHVLNGDCTKYNEAIDADTLLKVWDAIGMGSIGVMLAYMVRRNWVVLKDTLVECPGGMLMGMFNATATLALQGTTDRFLSFSDDFITSFNSPAELREIEDLLFASCHNLSLKKSYISVASLEINSCTLTRDGDLAAGLGCTAGVPFRGPLVTLKQTAAMLSGAVDSGVMPFHSAERLFQIKQQECAYRYNNPTYTTRNEDFLPTCLGGKTVISFQSLLTWDCHPFWYQVHPDGPDTIDQKVLSVLASKTRRRRTRLEALSDLDPLVPHRLLVSESDVSKIRAARQAHLKSLGLEQPTNFNYAIYKAVQPTAGC